MKVRKEGYDDSQATKLTVYDHCKLRSCFNAECLRKTPIMREYEATHPADTIVSPALDESGKEDRLPTRGPHVSCHSLSSSRDPSISGPKSGFTGTEIEPLQCSGDSSTSRASSVDSVDDLRGYNLSGWDPDPTVLFLPLVDIWFELRDQLNESNIPSPLEFSEEVLAFKR